MGEQDSSRARSTAPNHPFRISCKTDEGKVSIWPRIGHAVGYVSCCRNQNQRSHFTLKYIAELYWWIGFSTIYKGVRLQFKGEKRHHLNPRSGYKRSEQFAWKENPCCGSTIQDYRECVGALKHHLHGRGIKSAWHHALVAVSHWLV
jgi:hypothetical protein